MNKILMACLLLLVNSSLGAKILYIDPQVNQDCTQYNPLLRNCGGGQAQSMASFRRGLEVLVPGDQLVLRAGRYRPFVIVRSGTIDNPIIIQGYPGEKVVISGHQVGIKVVNKEQVIIKDLQVMQVQGFARVEQSTGIVFDNIDFSQAFASGTTGALKIVNSRYNRVSNSTFSQGSDLLILQDNANFNVVVDNDFGRSAHSLISIRCASQNVIRGNHFNNPEQKAMEIYDCQGISDAPVRLHDTRRNVIEDNQFVGTKGSWKSYKYNAIQHCGQQTIVRRNVFADNLGGGVHYQYYPKECLYVSGNRLYNNTFYHNRCFAIAGGKAPLNKYHDNRVVNNLLYRNSNCKGQWGQVSINNAASVFLDNNSIVDKDPGFKNVTQHDFTLTKVSREIDAGEFITETASSGRGTILKVDDASWFYDGFNIPGEQGDRIRIEKQNETANIMHIDYKNNLLILDKPLHWKSGQGVHLNFSNKAPDVGAYEYNHL